MTPDQPTLPGLVEEHRRLWFDLNECAQLAAEGRKKVFGRAWDHLVEAGGRLGSDARASKRAADEASRLIEKWRQVEASDIEWPVPEELERPGWEHVQARPGLRRYEMVAGPPPAVSMTSEEIQASTDPRLVEPPTVTIEPELHMFVGIGSPPEEWHLGLGWNVHQRTAVYFSWRVER